MDQLCHEPELVYHKTTKHKYELTSTYNEYLSDSEQAEHFWQNIKAQKRLAEIMRRR